MESNGQSLDIYPNPVRNTLFVEIRTAIKDDVAVRIVDASGKTVRQENREISGHAAFSINMSNMPAGMYSLQVKGKGTEMIKRFIKH